MNAVDKAYEVLEAIQSGLYGSHIESCLSSGGLVHLSAECVCMGIAFDPIDEQHEETFLVVFCCGNSKALSALGGYLASIGFKWVSWNRGVKGRGNMRYKKMEINKFVRLAKVCNHG